MHAAALTAFIAACATKRTSAARASPSTEIADAAVQTELDVQLELATHLPCPLGDAAHARAMQYLVDHADVAEPRLLAMLADRRGADTRSIAMTLARIGRPESVPALAAVL